jgi:tetraacyldisaccharide 4'-kinase
VSLEASLAKSWYRRKGGWTWCLAPLLLLTKPVVDRKRKRFLEQRIATSYQSKLPLIVVGNITVGGTGKSPMVIALAKLLTSWGYKPGIVTRGHKRESNIPVLVSKESKASQVGDEPLMLFRRTQCPVAVSSARVEAVKALESLPDVNVIISDDGLQHYKMDRDLEIVMVDAKRGLGNKQLLPVGPLREPPQRLLESDYVFSIGEMPDIPNVKHQYFGELSLGDLSHVFDKERALKKANLSQHQWTVVAAIGNPERFLASLYDSGLSKDSKRAFFSDHYHFQRTDITGLGKVIMTEKDAVKVESFASATDDWWYVSAELDLPEAFKLSLSSKLTQAIQQKN